MVYQVNELALTPIREVFNGTGNDVYICEDLKDSKKTYYTVILIKDHVLAKNVIRILNSAGDKKCYIDVFNHNEEFGIVFPYVVERYLKDFYMEAGASLASCESICVNLIMECLSTDMPYQFLYLILKEKEIFLRADTGVQLGFPHDLTRLKDNVGEKECVTLCGEIIRDLLGMYADKKADSFELVSRKVKKNAYKDFKELYFDIKLTSVNPDIRKGKLDTAKAILKERSQVLFRILQVICIILIICAILTILSMLTKGKIPFLVFFSNHFRTIGTQSLVK